MPGSAPRMIVELLVDRLDRALERAQVLRLDALERRAQCREALRGPRQPPRDVDQRDGEDEHDDGGEDDAEENEEMRRAHAPPNPSVSAFM